MNWVSVKNRNGESGHVLVWSLEYGALIGSYLTDDAYLDNGVPKWIVSAPGDTPLPSGVEVTHWCEVTPPDENN